jgi:hypothetical protein
MSQPRRAALLVLVLCALLVLTSGHPARGFETPTHDTINRLAITKTPAGIRPVVDFFLRDQMGFLEGIRTPLIDRRTPVDWVGAGGVAEDQVDGSETLGGLLRSTNHFHTPPRSWDVAGLKGTSQASVRWAQNREQTPGGRASWFDARAAFHAALVNPVLEQRQQGFADTFRILGQVMHLVADLASPPHTRDDMHPLGDSFETFMGEDESRIAGFSAFDPSLLRTAVDDDVAKLPIARLWDNDAYTGANPPDDSTGPRFGLAEFTSANFFSDDTITRRAFSDPDLPLPALDRLVEGPTDVYPPTGELRRYLSKPGDGVPVTHMVAEGLFFKWTPPFIAFHTLDDLVFADYATHLLPRAIGYASGVLQYFFRGRMQIFAPDRFVYGVAPFADGNDGQFTRLRFSVLNTTPNEAASTGQVTAVVQYRDPGVNIIEHPEKDLPDAPSFRVSLPQTVDLSSFKDLTFDFPAGIPANATDVFLMVVYRGPLGDESDAIAVGGTHLSEPTPIDIANVTDYFCYNGGLQHVAEIAPWEPPLHVERDLTGDRVPDLFGPYDEGGVFMKAGDIFGFTSASPSVFDASVSARVFPQYTRYLVLMDQPFYAVSWWDETLLHRGTNPNQVFSDAFFLLGFYPNVNRLVLAADGTARHVFVSSFVYRGLASLGVSILPPQSPQSFARCLGASFTLKPDLERIDSPIREP